MSLNCKKFSHLFLKNTPLNNLRGISTSSNDLCFQNVKQIIISDNINWEEIYQSNQPLVIKGLASSWPAVSNPSKKWSHLETLRSRIKEEYIVPIEVGKHYMDLKLQKFQISFDSFLDFLLNNKDSTAPDELPKIYLAQHELTELPILKEDVQIPTICLTTGKKHMYNIKLWFSDHRGSLSPCHYDPFHNMLVQIIGRKQVILADSKYKNELYPALKTVQKNTSLADLENPDFLKHPRLLEVKFLKADIEEGDALYMPFKWWHHCSSKELSCSVNFWWL